MDKVHQPLIDFYHRYKKLRVYEVMKKEFFVYLRNINAYEEYGELADKIDWKRIVELFSIEFNKLWNKMTIPQEIEELKKLKITFRTLVYSHIKVKLFHIAFLIVKEGKKNKLSKKKMNDNFYESMDYGMYEFFRVFSMQFTLTSLSEDNDPKVIIKKLESLKKFQKGKKFTPAEVPVFERLIEEIKEAEEKGLKVSIRELAFNSARKDFGYQDGKESIAYYNRFRRYLKKKKKNEK